MEDLVEGAIRGLDIFIKDRLVDIDLAPDLRPISVDAVQIQQVLTNLLENAVKFSAPGTPIRLAACVTNGELEISVTNTGPAIPSNELDKIFARFYRLDSGLSPRPPGTGLGLAICKAIIEAHGGRINARSLDGKTVFVLRLPLTHSMDEEPHNVPLLPLERTS